MAHFMLIETIRNAFAKKDKRVRLLLISGLIGIALIGLSQLIPSDGSGVPSAAADPFGDAEEYRLALEKQIAEAVSSIEGAGEARALITLESGVEYVYEKDLDRSLSESEDSTQASGSKSQQSSDSRESYILVEDENGRKTALVRKRLEPQVRGAVVLCEGGDDPMIAASVCDLVTTAFGIGYDRVCVIKLKP